MCRYFKILLSLKFILCVLIVSGQDLILTTPLQTFCPKGEIQIWDSITNYYYGVAGTGFIGRDEYIGEECTSKKQWAGPWKAIDGYKRTVCGYLFVKKRKTPLISSEKERYHLISDGDGDMVIYIIPDPAFRWLQFSSLRPVGHLHNDFTIAGEVTINEPGNSIESNAASFIKSLNLDSIQFKPVGFYGPWVSDVRNENSPEIHPLQQMWRREIIGSNVVEYQLYSFFDNSSRYSDTADFTGTCPSGVWMPTPLINSFYIPFEISLAKKNNPVYDISILSHNNINAFPRQEYKMRIIVNGVPRLEINKSNNTFPNISFYEVCQSGENTIYGYIKIDTSIGKADMKSGAHAILKILRTDSENK